MNSHLWLDLNIHIKKGLKCNVDEEEKNVSDIYTSVLMF